MIFMKLNNLVELSQGLCVNKKTKHLFSNKKENYFLLPLLKIANMLENNFDTFVSIDVNSKVIAKTEDLIYTRTGMVGYCFKGFHGVVHNNSFIIKVLDETVLNKDYLYFVLNSKEIKNQAEKMARTSVQPDLTHDMFKSLIIPLPNIKTQEKIVRILSSIDSQIERNNAMVQKLQNLGNTIYSSLCLKGGVLYGC